MTTKQTTKPARETYTILSGEGERGTSRTVKCTRVGLKRILTAERCGGDRWARAFFGTSTQGQPVED